MSPIYCVSVFYNQLQSHLLHFLLLTVRFCNKAIRSSDQSMLQQFILDKYDALSFPEFVY